LMSARSKRLSPVQSTQCRSSMNDNVHISRFGVSVLPPEYAGPVWVTSSVLADLVESMVDWDIARPEQAQGLTFKCVPGAAVLLLIQYRTPIIWTRQFGSRDLGGPDCRHFVTKRQSGVVVLQAGGPVGTICVHLKPERAASLLGERLQCFLEAAIGLDDIFGAGQVSLLEEMLSEAETSAERFACVERFLAANLRPRRVEPVACRAAAVLQRNPHLRVRRLAAQLDISERHLSRNFQAMFGTSPKQFARLARIESVMSARAQGATWADTAHTAGFTDQAHMINNFTEIVGMPPAQLVRPPSG
jgi:AraC-like DNA-binding protein